MLTQVLHDPNEIVSKLIFEDGEAIWETVAYKYEDRGVVCFSCQSGCRVGCTFCGTGRRFIRNLTADEMLQQVNEALKIIGDRPKIQIMCMSMGEPMDNWDAVKCFVYENIHFFKDPIGYSFYISTVGLDDRDEMWEDFVLMAEKIKDFGVQISLHHWDEEKRKRMLGNFKELSPLSDLQRWAEYLTEDIGRPVYWNYICTGKENFIDIMQVWNRCRGMHVTCSVLCNTNSATKTDPTPAIAFADKLLQLGNIEVSVFDPAGQDTVGGGCGQLLYVQNKLRGK